MTQTQTLLAIQHVAETNLAQVVATLFVVAPLRQLVAGVVAGDIGVEVGRVVRRRQ